MPQTLPESPAIYYFAYGSNLSKKQMKERCPDSVAFFPATLPNYKLLFVGWSRQWRGSTATVIPFKGEKVLGAIYRISEKDLRRLDSLEGCPATYGRVNVVVFNEDGEPVKAITYISQQAKEGKPSPDYLAIIQQGYRDWNIV